VTDDFAAAAEQATQQAQQSTQQTSTPVSVIPAGTLANSANPFGSSSEFGGGDFTPLPPMEFLHGRTLIYIPRKQVMVDDLQNAGQKRQIWSADLYVIDGGKLEFGYVVKANPDRGQAADEFKTWVHENCTPETPFTVLNSFVFQPSFNWLLNKLAVERRLALGTPKRVPTNGQRKAGMTEETVEAAYQAWVARGRMKPDATYAWSFRDATPEGQALAGRWWELNKDKVTLG
jgi:predicted dithiol-disulfide oxidoreductase (DUF899 family)